MSIPRQNLWLCLPIVLAWLFNNATTLLYQPRVYWAGDYVMAHEPAPLGLWLLKKHPLLFEAGMVGYLLFVCLLVLYLSRQMAMLASAAAVLGLVSTPLATIASHRPLDGYWICMAISVVAAVFLVASFQMHYRPDHVHEEVHEPMPQTAGERFQQEMDVSEE